MEKRIVLLSCAAQKKAYRSKVKDLYVSPLFKLNLKYAKQLCPDDIFVLSAKYGLLSLDQEIMPYDLTLNNMRSNEIKAWAVRVIEQIKVICSIENSEFIFLAGQKYRKYLLPHIKNYKLPLEGLGIGQQLQKLKTEISS